MPPLVEMKYITKVFPGVVANAEVSLEIEHGEIHALLGENGAGKTTIMNILYGIYHATSGSILVRGEPVAIHSSRDAIALGIGMVHQHFMLVPTMTVVENVVLGLRSLGFVLDFKTAKAEIARLSKSFGLEIDPSSPVSQLSVGMEQRVEIIKALYRGADLLIMDEPTGVLTPSEVKELIAILKGLAAAGKSVIFISHKLGEVLEVSDRVTVLRDGRKVATVQTSATNKAELARMMVGREVVFRVEKPQAKPGDVVLEVRDLNVMSDRALAALKDVSFDVRQGEILGIAGVDGNGQSELAEVLTGLRKAHSGEIWVSGHEVTHRGPAELHELRVGHIPEDRQRVGLVMDFSIAENFVIKDVASPRYASRGLVNWSRVFGHAEAMIQEYDVRCPGPSLKARLLSGGNQQKVVLAREMFNRPDLLVAVHPTRGLDVGATEYVERRLLDERSRGAAIVYISAELEEIMALSDRIAVLYGGQIMGIVDAATASVEQIGLMMAGAHRSDAAA